MLNGIKALLKEWSSTKKRSKMLSYPDPLSQEEDLKQIRMYVLVRRDVLPLVHCACQASHAVAEFYVLPSK
jgi:hypothetical protein